MRRGRRSSSCYLSCHNGNGDSGREKEGPVAWTGARVPTELTAHFAYRCCTGSTWIMTPGSLDCTSTTFASRVCPILIPTVIVSGPGTAAIFVRLTVAVSGDSLDQAPVAAS